MRNYVRIIYVVIDVLAIIALGVYAFVDNVALDVTCGVIIIIACVLELINLYMRKMHSDHNS